MMKKKYIYQNDDRLHPEIQEWGCYFRSCLWIAEDRTGKVLDADSINLLYSRSKAEGWIDSQSLEVQEPHRITEEAFYQLGDGRKVFQNGIFRSGQIKYWPWAKSERHYQRIDALIQKVQTINGNSHFRVVDKYGIVLFDPYYPSPKIDYIEYSTLYYIGEVA